MANLFWSPVRFFDARRRDQPDWTTALAAPAMCAGLQTVSVALFSGKTRPVVDAALAKLDLLRGPPTAHLLVAISVLTYPMCFGLLTLAVLALDVLTQDSGESGRLTEFTALSFYTQVPYCVAMILIAWVWVPEPLRLPSGPSTSDVLTAVYRYRDAMLSGPLLSTGRLLSYYSLLWLAAVLSAALTVVGGLSTRATIVTTIALATICAAGPILGGALRLLQ